MWRPVVGMVAGTILVFAAPVQGDTLGYLSAWGMNNSGQTDVPAGEDFTSIAGGYAFNIALRSDRSIVTWGADSWGTTTNVPTGNNYVGIDAGFFHGLAVRDDGSLVGWGHNQYG